MVFEILRAFEDLVEHQKIWLFEPPVNLAQKVSRFLSDFLNQSFSYREKLPAFSLLGAPVRNDCHCPLREGDGLSCACGSRSKDPGHRRSSQSGRETSSIELKTSIRAIGVRLISGDGLAAIGTRLSSF